MLKDSGCYTKMKVFSGTSLIYELLIGLYVSIEESVVLLRSEKSVSASLIQLQGNNYFNNLTCFYGFFCLFGVFCFLFFTIPVQNTACTTAQ